MNWLFCIKYILKIAITLAVRVFSCLWDVLPLLLQGGWRAVGGEHRGLFRETKPWAVVRGSGTT